MIQKLIKAFTENRRVKQQVKNLEKALDLANALINEQKTEYEEIFRQGQKQLEIIEGYEKVVNEFNDLTEEQLAKIKELQELVEGMTKRYDN